MVSLSFFCCLAIIVCTTQVVSLKKENPVAGTSAQHLREEDFCWGTSTVDGQDALEPATSPPVEHKRLWFDCTAVAGNSNVGCSLKSHAPKRHGAVGSSGGAVVIGALLPLSSVRVDPSKTTPRAADYGAVLYVESLLLAARSEMTRLVRDNPEFKNAAIGLDIRDTHERAEFSIEQTLRMLNHHADDQQSGSSESNACVQNIPVVIGPDNSADVTVTSNILAARGIPHVAYQSSSMLFGDRNHYPFLFRTVPSAFHEAVAIVDLMFAFGWHFMHLVASDEQEAGLPGRAAIMEFINSIPDMCTATSEIFSLEDESRMERTIRRIVLNELPYDASGTQYLAPNVVTMISTAEYARAFFNKMERMAEGGDDAFRSALRRRNLVWIASDGWAEEIENIKIFSGLYPHLGRHTVFSFRYRPPRHMFQELQQLNRQLIQRLNTMTASKANLQSNPWLKVAIENSQGCTFDETCNVSTDPTCRSKCNDSSLYFEMLKNKSRNLPTPIASGSLALAVQSAIRSVSHVFQKFKGTTERPSGMDYRLALLNNAGDCGVPSKGHIFTCGQEVHPSYTLLQLQNDSGRLLMKEVAEWKGCELDAKSCTPFQCLNSSAVNDTNLAGCVSWHSLEVTKKAPVSVCSLPCRPGQYRTADQSTFAAARRPSCCFSCSNCTGNTHSNASSEVCHSCGKYEMPTEDHSGCVLKEPVFISLQDPVGFGISLASGVCFLVVLVTMCVYIDKRWTVVIARTFPEESWLLLFSLCLSSGLVVVLFFRPTQLYCSGRAIANPTITTLMMCILLARSLRCVHLAPDKDNLPALLVAAAHRFGSSFLGQMVLIGSTVTVYFLLHLVWVILSPLEPRRMPGNDADTLYVYCSKDNVFNMVSAIVGLILYVVTLVVAIVARKALPSYVEKMISESKLILSAVCSQGIVWLVLMGVILLSHPLLSASVLALSLVVQNSVIWLCIFLPRLFLFASVRRQAKRKSSSIIAAKRRRLRMFSRDTGSSTSTFNYQPSNSSLESRLHRLGTKTSILLRSHTKSQMSSMARADSKTSGPSYISPGPVLTCAEQRRQAFLSSSTSGRSCPNESTACNPTPDVAGLVLNGEARAQRQTILSMSSDGSGPYESVIVVDDAILSTQTTPWPVLVMETSI
eukprot:scpid15819/ scgid29606/ Taste receptor type 1 member 2; G-protein coupled receptor 71; Sweet taste receptor T1R2